MTHTTRLHLRKEPEGTDLSRTWTAALADGTTVTAVYAATVTYNAERDGLFEALGTWTATITYPDGQATSMHADDGKTGAYLYTDALILAEEMVSGRTTTMVDDFLWSHTVGRQLTAWGITLDNDAALRMLGDAVLEGRRTPTDREIAVVTRVSP